MPDNFKMMFLLFFLTGNLGVVVVRRRKFFREDCIMWIPSGRTVVVGVREKEGEK